MSHAKVSELCILTTLAAEKILETFFVQLWPIISFGLVTGLTPGPNNTLLMISGANFGMRATVPHLAGVIFGFPTMVFTVGMGLVQFFSAYPLLHTILRIACVLWILWLAVRLIGSRKKDADSAEIGQPISFFAAAAFQWINPKAWIMAVGSIALFVPVGTDTLIGVARVTLGFFLVAIPSSLTWCIFGAVIATYLSTDFRVRVFNIIMTLLLIISIVPVLF